jgi:formylglycine-generating enzyme required for sulfatase activity
MRFVPAIVVGLCLGFTSLLADEPAKPAEVTEDWHGVTFVRIPAGEFIMGSEEAPVDLANAGIKVLDDYFTADDEGPSHRVKISAFQMGKYELTRGQFRLFVEATGYKTYSEKDPEGGWGLNRQLQRWFSTDGRPSGRQCDVDGCHGVLPMGDEGVQQTPAKEGVPPANGSGMGVCVSRWYDYALRNG